MTVSEEFFEVDKEVSTIKNNEDKNKTFKVDSEAKADWVFRKIKEIRADKEDHQAKYKEHKEALDDWNKSKSEELERSEEHFTILLQEYYGEEKTKNPKYELDTPAGRLSTSWKKTWDYENQDLIDFLETRGYEDLINVTKAPKKADIKKTFKALEDGFVYDENGEKVEGIKIKDELKYNLTLREPKWKEGEF